MTKIYSSSDMYKIEQLKRVEASERKAERQRVLMHVAELKQIEENKKETMNKIDDLRKQIAKPKKHRNSESLLSPIKSAYAKYDRDNDDW